MSKEIERIARFDTLFLLIFILAGVAWVSVLVEFFDTQKECFEYCDILNLDFEYEHVDQTCTCRPYKTEEEKLAEKVKIIIINDTRSEKK